MKWAWDWLVRLLVRLEYGVYLYCDAMRIKAAKEGAEDLAKLLEIQAAQELGHHNRLKALLGRGPTRKYSAIEYSQHIHGDSPVIHGDSSMAPEGISRRYLVARIAFDGQCANELDWPNALAMMAVGESLARRFYKFIGDLVTCPDDYWPEFKAIADDEGEHCADLIGFMGQHISHEDVLYLTQKWECKVRYAFAFIWLEPGFQILRRLKIVYDS